MTHEDVLERVIFNDNLPVDAMSEVLTKVVQKAGMSFYDMLAGGKKLARFHVRFFAQVLN